MLERIADLPEGVIGFVGRGEIHADDYRNVLMPAIDAELAAGRDLRVVLVFERWDGMSGGALWEDLKMGAHHLSRWKRIALVSDVDWMVHLTHLFGWMTPGELEVFPLAERAAAVAWAAEG
jgi:hypothetical protein